MEKLAYLIPEKLILKNHSNYNEVWLQDRIADNPSILGLGEVEVIDRERRQNKAGRLDLLLANIDKNSRYEVEIQ
jgi:RecB family endonuclease NucS